MIIRSDLDGCRRYVSPASRELLGYEPEDMLGQDLTGFVHPEDLPDVAARLAGLASDCCDQDTVTYRARHRDGRWVWLEAHRRLVRDAQGRPQEIVGVVRDVSERRRLEDQLRRWRRWASSRGA
jgi:PAS domain S-box-containing protein